MRERCRLLHIFVSPELHIKGTRRAKSPPANASTLSSMELSLLREISLKEINNTFDDQSFTSTQLVGNYLVRIEEVDMEFRSMLDVNKDAISISSSLDKKRQQHRKRGHCFCTSS